MMPHRIAVFVLAAAAAAGGTAAQQPPIAVYDAVVSPTNFSPLESAIWGAAALASPRETLGNAVIMYAYNREVACAANGQYSAANPALPGEFAGFALPSDTNASPPGEGQFSVIGGVLFHGPTESCV